MDHIEVVAEANEGSILLLREEILRQSILYNIQHQWQMKKKKKMMVLQKVAGECNNNNKVEREEILWKKMLPRIV